MIKEGSEETSDGKNKGLHFSIHHNPKTLHELEQIGQPALTFIQEGVRLGGKKAALGR